MVVIELVGVRVPASSLEIVVGSEQILEEDGGVGIHVERVVNGRHEGVL